MQALNLRVIGNAYLRVWQSGQPFHSLGICNATIGRRDDAQPVLAVVTEAFQLVVYKVNARQLQKRYNHANAVSTLYVALNFAA